MTDLTSDTEAETAVIELETVPPEPEPKPRLQVGGFAQSSGAVLDTDAERERVDAIIDTFGGPPTVQPLAASVTITPTPSAVMGIQLNISAAGFGATAALTCRISNPEEQFSTTLLGTAVAGAFNFNTVGLIVPQREGIITITISDGTSTVVSTVRIDHA